MHTASLPVGDAAASLRFDSTLETEPLRFGVSSPADHDRMCRFEPSASMLPLTRANVITWCTVFRDKDKRTAHVCADIQATSNRTASDGQFLYTTDHETKRPSPRLVDILAYMCRIYIVGSPAEDIFANQADATLEGSNYIRMHRGPAPHQLQLTPVSQRCREWSWQTREALILIPLSPNLAKDIVDDSRVVCRPTGGFIGLASRDLAHISPAK